MMKFLNALATLLLIWSCAKERPKDLVEAKVLAKLEGLEHSKSDLLNCTFEDPCLWTPSVLDTPYKVDSVRPYELGDSKLVVTKITKDHYEILEIDENDFARGNEHNLSPVAKINIDHVDYTCARDSFDQCTNIEKEDNEKIWSDRRYVRFKDIEIKEKNTLSLHFADLFRAGCFNEVSHKEATGEDDKFAKVENKAINLTVKTMYNANASCVMLQSISDLRYLNFTIDYHYSLNKLSDIVDPTYKKVDYKVSDHGKFGFFKTEKQGLSVDHHDHYMGLKSYYLNRFSPHREEVVYYLNDAFFKPENAAILKSTQKVFSNLNKSLEKAGIKFKLRMKQKPREQLSGDVRHSELVMIEDPQASGVIGYGPSVKNPLTGEIISARTVMYYGTMKKFISRTYDEYVDYFIAQMQAKEQGQVNNSNESDDETDEETHKVDPKKNEKSQNTHHSKAKKELALSLDSLLDHHDHSHAHQKVNATIAQKLKAHSFDRDAFMKKFKLPSASVVQNFVMKRQFQARQDITQIYDRFFPDSQKEKIYRELKSGKTEFQEKMEQLAKKTFYHSSLYNFDQHLESSEVLTKIKKMYDNQELGYWDDLDPKMRKELLDIIAPEVWESTLTHEIGHNLGLRHNFAGSTDKDNFYTAEERKELGIKKEVKYSSVMDYAYSSINELGVMGKYDIAALKFGYTGQVEENKSYKFCTDENQGTSVTCNVFDQGVEIDEIAEHYKNLYTKNFKKISYRNRRYSFSGRYGDFNHFIRTINTFFRLYNFFSIYDQMVFNGSFDDLEKESEEEQKRLNRYKKASDIAFDTLMSTIETPSYHCLKFNTTDNTIDIKPFSEMVKGTRLASFGITFDIRYGCFYLENFEREKYKEEGKEFPYRYFSVGEHLNNSLDIQRYFSGEGNPYDTSEMDIRGHWIDKLAAAYVLTIRSQVPTTIGAASNGTFSDYPEYKKRMMTFLEGMTLNKVTLNVPVKNANDTVVTELDAEFSFGDDYMVNKSYNMYMSYFAGLDKTRTDLREVLLRVMKENFKTPQNNVDLELDTKTFSTFDVTRISPNTDPRYIRYDKLVEFKNSRGEVIYRFSVFNYNTLAMKLVERKSTLDMVLEMQSLATEESFNEFVQNFTSVNELESDEEKMAFIKKLEEQDKEVTDFDKVMYKLLKQDPQIVAAAFQGDITNLDLLKSFLILSI